MSKLFTVILNGGLTSVFRNLIGGRPDGRKLRRQAIISEQSSQSFLCPPLEGGPKSLISRRGQNNGSLDGTKARGQVITGEQSSRKIYPLSLERVSEIQERVNTMFPPLSPSLISEGDNLISRFTSHSSLKKKIAFTLAEVLITLGIIGVVAAMTMPSLIQNYQKNVYYSQFRKASAQLENALKLWAYDNGCEGNVWNCSTDTENLENSQNFVDELVKYFKVSQKIDDANYSDVCNGYNKLPASFTLKNPNSNRTQTADELCINDRGINSNIYAFITVDGVLYNFSTDFGAGNGLMVDINGPNSAPNIFGRDMFVFYLRDWTDDSGISWNNPLYTNPEPKSICAPEKNDGDGTNCAARLLMEGKMNY